MPYNAACMSTRWRILLLPLLFFSAVVLAFPVFVMRPFQAQKPASLTLALAVERWSLLLTVVAAAAGAILVVKTWARAPERFAAGKNLAMVVAAALLTLAIPGSRVNIFERIFHPIGEIRFISAVQAQVEPTEMVISVHTNQETRAYPILQMAYHHVVNDTLAGQPIVITY